MTTLLQSAQTNKIPYNTGINSCYNQINSFVLNPATYFQKKAKFHLKITKKSATILTLTFSKV